MTLADLLTELDTRGALPASRVKDMKTSLRYLASALGQGALEQCPVEGACRDPDAWTTVLDAHFTALETQGRTISAITRRNTRNNLRALFRQAEAHGLLQASLPPRLLAKPRRDTFKQQYHATAPYQATYHPQNSPRRYGLPQTQWPPDIVQGWQRYQAKCGLRLREESFSAYAKCLTSYLGYLVHICGRQPVWEDLFDAAQLTAFVRWHGARVGRPVSTHARQVVVVSATIAQVLGHDHARALAALRSGLKHPAPMHAKQLHWVSLAQLEAVAEAYLRAGRIPVAVRPTTRSPGIHRTARFQQGVILKLLVRIPLRQRNVREMRLEQNIFKDPAGHWWIRFAGDELKIGTRQGRVNEYKVNLTEYRPEFIPVLEEFLQVHRPRLPGAATSPFVFLTQSGRPFTGLGLRLELSYAVSMHTGQRFYPHLIRTIWATEFLEEEHDYAAAATMLGDTLAVVLKTYYHVTEKDHHRRGSAFLDKKLHAG